MHSILKILVLIGSRVPLFPQIKQYKLIIHITEMWSGDLQAKTHRVSSVRTPNLAFIQGINVNI